MATHSSYLAWEIAWTEEPGRLHAVHGVKRVRHDIAAKPPSPLLKTKTQVYFSMTLEFTFPFI